MRSRKGEVLFFVLIEKKNLSFGSNINVISVTVTDFAYQRPQKEEDAHSAWETPSGEGFSIQASLWCGRGMKVGSLGASSIGELRAPKAPFFESFWPQTHTLCPPPETEQNPNVRF